MDPDYVVLDAKKKSSAHNIVPKGVLFTLYSVLYTLSVLFEVEMLLVSEAEAEVSLHAGRTESAAAAGSL